jgi:plastocyanin
VRVIARLCGIALITFSVFPAERVIAQSVVERTPNLSGPWVDPPGVLQFNFLHRFSAGPAPQRKVSNFPTFLVGVGLPHSLMLGAQYATNSQVADRVPNEWEFFGRFLPLSQDNGRVIDASVEAAYNHAAQSADGELALARTVGPLRVIAAARAFSHAYGHDDVRFAVAGGGALKLGRWLSVAGDVAKVLNKSAASGASAPVLADVAWGAGVQLAIPYTPHSLSLQVSNANTATLEGASRSSGARRYGFEFTVPIALRRYFSHGNSTVATAGATATKSSPMSGARVRAGMRALAFTPAHVEIAQGTTVEWTNRDQVAHTVTADDGSWDSGVLEPGATWRHTFDRAGAYPFHCAPHPFMKGVVSVK